MESYYLLLRQHIEMINPLTDEEWDYVMPFFTYKKLKKYQFLLQKEDSVHSEYWIINGLLKTYALDDSGKEHILQFAMENYWTSDYYALQYHLPGNLYIDCIEDSEFFCLRMEDREQICKNVPAMTNFFRVKSNYGYIALQQRVMSLLTETAEEKYNNIIKKLPHLIQRIPKKLLASYLGVTRETLSRLKS